MDKKDFESLLKKYPDCVSDGKKLKALLKDLYPDVPKAIVNTLTIMADDGIISEMQMSAESSMLVAARLQKKLEDDYGLSQKIISDCFLLIAHKNIEFSESVQDVAYDSKDFEIVKGVLKKYKGNSSVVVIPDSVTSIGVYAFCNCSGLTSITIPDSVTGIDSFAFSDCSGLTSITIPDSVTSIGKFAFSDCSGLMSVTIPDSVTSISSYAFNGCSGLTSVTIGNGVTRIGASAFCGCSGLVSITIPESVTSIDIFTFCNCTALTSVTIGNGVTSIGTWAFSSCTGLTSITIPESVTSIGDDAFSGCRNLTIYCEAESKPIGWSSDWNLEHRPVVWGMKNKA